MRSFGEVSAASKGATSGFDYLRLILALSVLVWHSYPISYGGAAASEIWNSWFGALIRLILPMFFALSGFLVCSSLLRVDSITKFLAYRALRIFPALSVEVVVSAFILGTILTRVPLHDYFLDSQFRAYLANIFGIVHYNLPGVFESNPIPSAMNISLWTVPYELECYIALTLLFVFGLTRQRFFLFSFSAAMIAIIAYGLASGTAGYNDQIVSGKILVLSFLAGVGTYIYRDFIKHSAAMAALAAIVSVILASNPYLAFFLPVPITYLTVYLGLLDPKRHRLMLSGDYSYGIYLYAAPAQQTIRYLLGDHNTWFINAALAIPVAIAIAVMSWFAIEKPFLRLKKLVPDWKPQWRGGRSAERTAA
jgi:peptidoglycan/LPS O-acetylase OafA/YrhL